MRTSIRKILVPLLFSLSPASIAQVTIINTILVGYVSASDPDSGQVLVYQIISGNQENYFTIDHASGKLSVSRNAFNTFEKSRTWRLTVLVSDGSSRNSLSSRAFIDVTLNKAGNKAFVAYKKW